MLNNLYCSNLMESPRKGLHFSLITIVYSLLTTFSSCELPNSYTECVETYSCGHIKNITYPFMGGDRPKYCGLPPFNLTCVNNISTELTHNSVTFRVSNINQSNKTLTLVRQDFYNTTCPSTFLNTTLNSTLFTINDQNQMLTLIYGCNSMPTYLQNQSFSCDRNNIRNSGYYIIGPVPSDFMSCRVSVTLPILKDVGEKLISNQMSLTEALMEGFIVNYNDPYEEMCNECHRYGGGCGFDSDVTEPLCVGAFVWALGPDSIDGFQNVSSNSQGTRSTGMKILSLVSVLGVGGAAVALIGLIFSIFFCIRWRKRVAVEAESSTRCLTKDIKTNPLSRSFTSQASSNFTENISSCPSSKSDPTQGSSYFGVQIFKYTDLQEATNNFASSRELGDGGFGAVYYGKLVDGREVAVKRLYRHSMKRVKQFMNEVEILARIRHKNLVLLYGCTLKKSKELLLVYEYIPNGTVADHLYGKKANSGLLTWPIRLKIAIETADALAYLHKSDCIHRDVKTTNILLDNDFQVKVGDFGLSRLFPTNVTHVSTAPQGTPGYVDPEYYNVYQLTEKSDVYSFGVVLIELISSLQAVDITRHSQEINLASMAINKIQNHELNELVDQSLRFETNNSDKKMVSSVAELAFRCLQPYRDMRPSMQEVLEALGAIQNYKLSTEKQEFEEIVIDDVALLKGNSDPDLVSSNSSQKTININSASSSYSV